LPTFDTMTTTVPQKSRTLDGWAKFCAHLRVTFCTKVKEAQIKSRAIERGPWLLHFWQTFFFFWFSAGHSAIQTKDKHANKKDEAKYRKTWKTHHECHKSLLRSVVRSLRRGWGWWRWRWINWNFCLPTMFWFFAISLFRSAASAFSVCLCVILLFLSLLARNFSLLLLLLFTAGGNLQCNFSTHAKPFCCCLCYCCVGRVIAVIVVVIVASCCCIFCNFFFHNLHFTFFCSSFDDFDFVGKHIHTHTHTNTL